MQVSGAEIKASTRAMIGGLAVIGALLQVQPVHDFLIEQLHGHPHIVSLIGTALGIYGLLHNPQVKAVLHADGKPHWWTTDEVVDAAEKK